MQINDFKNADRIIVCPCGECRAGEIYQRGHDLLRYYALRYSGTSQTNRLSILEALNVPADEIVANEIVANEIVPDEIVAELEYNEYEYLDEDVVVLQEIETHEVINDNNSPPKKVSRLENQPDLGLIAWNCPRQSRVVSPVASSSRNNKTHQNRIMSSDDDDEPIPVPQVKKSHPLHAFIAENFRTCGVCSLPVHHGTTCSLCLGKFHAFCSDGTFNLDNVAFVCSKCVSLCDSRSIDELEYSQIAIYVKNSVIRARQDIRGVSENVKALMFDTSPFIRYAMEVEEDDDEEQGSDNEENKIDDDKIETSSALHATPNSITYDMILDPNWVAPGKFILFIKNIYIYITGNIFKKNIKPLH